MEDRDSIGAIIKRYCKCRNKRLKDVAALLKMKESTFSMARKNNTLTADQLMKLAAYLDIDLNEMMIELGYSEESSIICDSTTVPRMSAAHREKELEIVNKRLADLLQMYPNSIPTVRNELLNYYNNNMAFLLDIILPENARIVMSKSLNNPKKEDYNVWSAEEKADGRLHGLRGVTGKHVLDSIITQDNPEKQERKPKQKAYLFEREEYEKMFSKYKEQYIVRISEGSKTQPMDYCVIWRPNEARKNSCSEEWNSNLGKVKV